MELWNWVNRNGLQFISLQAWLKEGINMAFSARTEGVSNGAYKSLNMGLHVGDTADLVLENRRRYLSIFNADLDDMVACQQVHGNEVRRVNCIDRGKGARSLDEVIMNCDAMITNEPGIYLMSFYADCIPVYFYDPINRAIGMAHSGWKGTMKKIVVNTLEAMYKEFNTCANEVQIFIGPGIGFCCFEIQSDLLAKVKAEFNSFHDIINNKNGLITWDLQETNLQLLKQEGVNPLNISTCKLCTACCADIFYSYRRENGDTGRMGALIGMEY
ncbi:MAG: peptidoglycan editing factor PgeF [Firmicutes bacterium HGW-Firmicutes-15]|nr:MAG: peptidoglycan editing factor PgeF [Firmicutes bacterium HGW-Firmicutes-15]